MVIPVPVVLQPEDVRTVEGDLVATVAKFSEPREVAYTCDDFKPARSQSGLGCIQELSASVSRDRGAVQPPSDVVVESSFSVGIYEIVVLSAEESSSLMEWLSTNGYGGCVSGSSLGNTLTLVPISLLPKSILGTSWRMIQNNRGCG